MIRTALIGVVALATLLLPVTAAGAAEVPDDVSPGPAYSLVDGLDAFACGPAEAPVPPNHCINVRSQGRTGLILVFAPDDRGPQESISFDERADRRPCPHDPDSPDGTWWQPTPAPFWVCHHRP